MQARLIWVSAKTFCLKLEHFTVYGWAKNPELSLKVTHTDKNDDHPNRYAKSQNARNHDPSGVTLTGVAFSDWRFFASPLRGSIQHSDSPLLRYIHGDRRSAKFVAGSINGSRSQCWPDLCKPPGTNLASRRGSNQRRLGKCRLSRPRLQTLAVAQSFWPFE